MIVTEVVLSLPPWVRAFVADRPDTCPNVEARMGLVLDLATAQVAAGTGGPFAAAVFERSTGRLVAPAVNVVVPASASIAHAEIMALSLAGQVVGSHDLSTAGELELVTSTEPCAMCLGAIPWSGVRSVVAGARDEDARAIGFDEGSKPADWAESLRQRGIEVTVDVLRDRARGVLERYAEGDGAIYNGATGGGASGDDAT